MSLFKDMCNDIRMDEKKTENDDYEYIMVEEEADDHITVFDSMEGEVDSKRYTIRNPEYMDRDYFRSIVDFSDCAEAYRKEMPIDKEKVVEYLDGHMDKNMLMTVDRILFVTGDEEDDDKIFKNERVAEGAFEAGHWLPDKNQVGLTWWDYDIVCISLKGIREGVDECVNTFRLDKDEERDEINIGVLTTLVHEVRHTAQDNPYLPEKFFGPVSRDKEKDAEEYARDWVERHPFDILLSKEKKRGKGKPNGRAPARKKDGKSMDM